MPLNQSGTFWYHSHSGFQEQVGLYGSIIVDPKHGYAQRFDRDYVVVLSDWTDTAPEDVVSNIKFQNDYYNFHQRDAGTFFADVRRHGLGATIKDRAMWGRMRMSATDIPDVTGATYTYLLHGHAPNANWTGLFKPGERVRLRFINAGSTTFFDVHIPGLASRQPHCIRAEPRRCARPIGRPWGDTTIRGQADRGTGLVNNILFIGRLFWNRCSYIFELSVVSVVQASRCRCLHKILRNSACTSYLACEHVLPPLGRSPFAFAVASAMYAPTLVFPYSGSVAQ